jgi:hypothetical protein
MGSRALGLLEKGERRDEALGGGSDGALLLGLALLSGLLADLGAAGGLLGFRRLRGRGLLGLDRLLLGLGFLALVRLGACFDDLFLLCHAVG